MATPAGVIPVSIDTSQIPRQFADAMARAQRAVRPIDIRFNSQPLGRITGEVKELTKSLDASSARVIAFGATTGFIYGLGRAFTELAKSTILVEKKLQDIQVILGASSANFQKLSSGIFNIANQTAKSFEDVADAAQEFARQGLPLNETLKRTRDAMILVNTSGISAKDAVDALTAAVNTFGKEALDTTSIINKLANVDAAFAVSQKDLAEGISRVGSAASDANVSFDELVATITSAQQTTARGGAAIGNSLKTIFTRLERPQAIDSLKALGVQLEKSNGESLNAVQVLRNLAQVYNTLSDSQKNSISQQVAGVHQINIFKAVISDLSRQYSILDRAQGVSADSTNEAITRNKELTKTLSAQGQIAANNVTNALSKAGNVVFAPNAKALLGSFNDIFDKIGSGNQAESGGAKIAEGFLKGLGAAIRGPGAVTVAAIFLGLFKRVGKFAYDSIKELSGLNSSSTEQAAIQETINGLLQTGNQYYVQRLGQAKTVQEQESIILELMRAQNAEVVKQAATLSSVSARLSRSFSAEGGSIVPKAVGYIPHASGGLLPALLSEKTSIRKSVGGANNGARPSVIPNFNFGGGKTGSVVANTSEYIINNYKGGSGSAIFNPDMVKQAGGLSSLSKLGKVSKVAANGIIPNFAFGFGGRASYLEAHEKIYNGALVDPNLKYLYSDNESVDYKQRLQARKAGFELLSHTDAAHIAQNKDQFSFLSTKSLNVVDPTGGFKEDHTDSIFKTISAKSYKGNKFTETQDSKSLPQSQNLNDFLKGSKIKKNQISKFLEAAENTFGQSFFVKSSRGLQGNSVYGKDVLSQLKRIPNGDDLFIQKGIPNISGKEYRVSVAGVKSKTELLGQALLRAENGRLHREFIGGSTRAPSGSKLKKLGDFSNDFFGRRIAEIQGKRAFSDLPSTKRRGAIGGLDVAETGNTGVKRVGQYLAELLGLKILPGGGVIELNLSQNEKIGNRYGAQPGYSGSLDRTDVAIKAGNALLKHSGGNFYAGGLIPNFAEGKLLGKGHFASFYDYGDSVDGVRVGEKKFDKKNFVYKGEYLKSSFDTHITDEFNAAKALEYGTELGAFGPHVKGARVYNDLKDALKNRRLIKEIVRGGSPDRVSDSIRNAGFPFDTANKIGGRIASHINEQVRQAGVIPTDLHHGNFSLNPEAAQHLQDILVYRPKDAARYASSPEGIKELLDQELFFPNGKATIFDSGKLKTQYRNNPDLNLLKKTIKEHGPYALANGYTPLDTALKTEKLLTGQNPKIGLDSRLPGKVGVFSPSQGSLAQAINQHLQNEPGRNLGNLGDTGSKYQGKIPNFAPVGPPSASDILLRIQQLEDALKAEEQGKVEQAKDARTRTIRLKAEAGESLSLRDLGHLSKVSRAQTFADAGIGGEQEASLLKSFSARGHAVISGLETKANEAVGELQSLSINKGHEKTIADFFSEQRRSGGFTTVGVEKRFRQENAGVQLNKANEGFFSEGLGKLQQERAHTRNQLLFGASFAAPIVAQSIQGLVGANPESRASRTSNRLIEAASTGATIASLAPNKLGLVAAGLITTFSALKAVTGNVASPLETFLKNIDESNNRLNEQSNAITQTISSFDQFQQILSQGGGYSAVKRAGQNLTDNLSQVSGPNKDKLLGAIKSGDIEKLRDVEAENVSTLNARQKISQFGGQFIQANEQQGATGNVIKDSLLGSRRDLLEAAKNPAGNATSNFLFSSGLSSFLGIGSGKKLTTDNVRSSFSDLPEEKFKGLLDSANAIPIDSNKLNLGDLKKQRAGGTDPSQIIKTIFGSSGFDDPNLLSNLQTGSLKQVGSIADAQIKRVEESQKDNDIRKALGDTGGKIRKFVKLSEDIIQNVGFSFQTASVARQASRDRILTGTQGFLSERDASLTSEAKQQVGFAAANTQTEGDTRDNVEGIINQKLGELRIPQDQLRVPEVANRIAESVSNIVKTPTSVTTEFKKIGEALSAGTDDKQIVESFEKGGESAARDIFLAIQKGGIEQAKNLLNNQIALSQIQRQKESSFLGGDQKALINPDFSELNQGFGGFRNQRLLGKSIFNANGRDRIAEGHRDRNILNEQSSAFLELDKLGILPKEGASRDNARGVIEKAFAANLNNALDQLGRSSIGTGQEDLIKNARGLVGQSAKTQAENALPGAKDVNAVLGALNGQKDIDSNANSQISQQIASVVANSLALDHVSAQLEKLSSTIGTPDSIEDQTKGALKNIPELQPGASKASGYVPNFSAYSKEIRDIKKGIGGALSSDRPFATNIKGLGNTVVNSGESIIRNFLGSNHDAVFNRQMAKEFGMPLSSLGKVDSAASGFIPNFADDSLLNKLLLGGGGVAALSALPFPKSSKLALAAATAGYFGSNKLESSLDKRGYSFLGNSLGLLGRSASVGLGTLALSRNPFAAASALGINAVGEVGKSFYDLDKENKQVQDSIRRRGDSQRALDRLETDKASGGSHPSLAPLAQIKKSSKAESGKSTVSQETKDFVSSLKDNVGYLSDANLTGDKRKGSENYLRNSLSGIQRALKSGRGDEATRNYYKNFVASYPAIQEEAQGKLEGETLYNKLRNGTSASQPRVAPINLPSFNAVADSKVNNGVVGSGGSTLEDALKSGRIIDFPSAPSANPVVTAPIPPPVKLQVQVSDSPFGGYLPFPKANKVSDDSELYEKSLTSTSSPFGGYKPFPRAIGFIPSFAKSTLSRRARAAIRKRGGTAGLNISKTVGPLTQIKQLIDEGSIEEAQDAILNGGLPASFLNAGLNESNLGGVSQAIQREYDALLGRGIPKNLAGGYIFVGKSPEVGVGVGNYLDEPRGRIHPNLGLQQGIDRVKSQGGNPRSNGAPNFAAKGGADLADLIKTLQELIASLSDNKTNSTGAKGDENGVKVDHNISVNASINGKIDSANSDVQAIFQQTIDQMKAQIAALQSSQKGNPNFVPKPPTPAPESANTSPLLV